MLACKEIIDHITGLPVVTPVKCIKGRRKGEKETRNDCVCIKGLSKKGSVEC